MTLIGPSFFGGDDTADHADRADAGPRYLRIDISFFNLKIEEIFDGQDETHLEAVEDIGGFLAVLQDQDILDQGLPRAEPDVVEGRADPVLGRAVGQIGFGGFCAWSSFTEGVNIFAA